MKSIVRDAFIATNCGYSADRVIADPDLNLAFIKYCSERLTNLPATELNALLLNLRKRGDLSGLPKAKRTSFSNESEYRFASELAVRFLERRDCLTLDQILCDPECAARFDEIAARIVPGFSALQYRWAALNLRKQRRLRPEIVSQVLTDTVVKLYFVEEIVPDQLPVDPGIYIFYSGKETLYVGESENLRKRIKKHLDHSDNKGLARWMWENADAKMFLELHVLPNNSPGKIRRALESELIHLSWFSGNWNSCRLALAS